MLIKRRPKKSYLLKYRGTKCLNCEHPLDLSDRYCPKCSQINSTKRITFFDLIREFFDAMFSYDSKFRQTIYVIVRHPGQITKEYISGKRNTYTNPFRFFLSILFITIILLNFTFDFETIDEGFRRKFNRTEKEVSQVSDSIKKQIEKNSQTTPVITIGSKRNETDSIKATSVKEIDSLHYSKARFYFDSINKSGDGLAERISFKADIFKYGIEKDSMLSYSHLAEKMRTDKTWENRIAYKLGFNQYKATSSPSLYISYLINKLPFVVFFLIPFLALFIWLIYSKKKYYYMDHLVFCYQTLTMLIFSYLVCIVIFLITQHSLTFSLLITAIIFYNWFYLYKAMRRFYGQSRLKTFLKYIYINTIFSILAFFTTLLFMGISFLLF